MINLMVAGSALGCNGDGAVENSDTERASEDTLGDTGSESRMDTNIDTEGKKDTDVDTDVDCRQRH